MDMPAAPRPPYDIYQRTAAVNVLLSDADQLVAILTSIVRRARTNLLFSMALTVICASGVVWARVS
jgi:hypothetical protein